MHIQSSRSGERFRKWKLNSFTCFDFSATEERADGDMQCQYAREVMPGHQHHHACTTSYHASLHRLSYIILQLRTHP